MPFGMCVSSDCEGSQSKTQVFVSNYLPCIARPRIKAIKSTHKRTTSGADCKVSHSNHDQKPASKIIVLREIGTTELGMNLKPILCIGKGPHCVHIVPSLRIKPQSNLVVHQRYHSR